MNTKALTVLLMVCITIITCVVYITVLGNNKVVENPVEGIVLEIKESTITSTGLTLVIKNVAPNGYCYGSHYRIDERVNGQWVSKIPTSTVWTDELGILSKNSNREVELSWEWRYGELSPGNYRVVKDFAYLYLDRTNGDYYPISVEFTIN